ncbi:MAG: PEP/pyruvate-binding domain-containing protein [Promethearchaeota archaeon]
MNYIKLFGEGVPNINLYGGKGANLIKLVKEGFDVPYGFIINTKSYNEFLESSEYSKQITELLTKEFNSKDILQHSSRLKSLILKSKIPEVVKHELKISYKQFRSEIEESDSFAVRSSATIEDSNIFSFAGQADTYLFINSFEDLLISLKNCWASLFSPGALLYLLQMKKQGVLDSLINIRMAVVVQKMVESEISGVLFTVNVMTNNDNEMLINSTWGLGETIADNKINPDMIIINSLTRKIILLVI